MSSSQQTRYTLIQRAFDSGDQAAWEEFVEHYRRFIFYVLHGLNVAQDDIEDITQQILICLTRDLPTYDRSRSKFRTWLSSVIRNVAVTNLRKKGIHESRFKPLIDEAEAENVPCASEIDAYIEKEWATYISSQAMNRVRKVFQGAAVEAFELALDGLSGEEIAQRTGLTVSSVYTLRKRVKKRLYLEILDLTENLEP